MAPNDLVDRLARLGPLARIPRAELEWLVEHGRHAVYPTGAVLAPKGEPVPELWIILSGHVAVRVDRGAGPRRVMGWRAGDVSGMLPYSRMVGPPGDNYLEEETEIVAIHTRDFPELACRCPAFTAYTVHLMLDRARSFNTSDLQDEKMLSLGRLAAGLAHELNNPASAAVRGARLLGETLAEADAVARGLGAAGLTPEQRQAIASVRDACALDGPGPVLSPIALADREDELRDWLEAHGCDPEPAPLLAGAGVSTDRLDELAEVTPAGALDDAVRWIAVGCSTHSLARDIEGAATRIHDLVAAVKRFTYMDRVAAPEPTDIEPGLQDTVRVITSKARSKGVSVNVEVEEGLPPVRAIGSELNQVWLNLIDNALDAVPRGGHVEIRASRALDRVVVRVIDDGPGIPDDARPHVFDLFFTTKPPGQGTGLGLEMARRLVRQHRGDITVESRPGRTEFRVELPAADPGARG
jgi:signal transduction histidine kinase